MAFKVNMEVCANSVTSALAAQRGGAKRVELCASLTEGGTTPSYGEIAMARKLLDIEIFPIIRPRGGDFLYSDLEFEIMKEEVKICRELGCDGIVTGILLPDGTIDEARCAELIALAQPMQAAFHRAFDMVADTEGSLEVLISLGFVRVLSSGAKDSAIEGAEMLANLIKQAAGRICIMPGAGVNTENIAELIRITGAAEFHASARKKCSSKMLFRNPDLNMGDEADEYSSCFTDAGLVKNLLERANNTD
jgi:copper homeostasis protein